MRLAKRNVDCAGSVTPQSTLDAQGKALPPSSPRMRRTENRGVEGEIVLEKDRTSL